MTVYQQPIKFGLAIDWETSGAAWGKDSTIEYQGLAYGAIIFDTETFEPIENLYVEIKFDESKYKWSPEAEKIHGLSREHLETNGVSQEDAAVGLIELIAKYFPGGTKVLVLAHNAEFDIRFTDQLMSVVGFEFSIEQKHPTSTHIPVHHVVLNTSAIGLIAFGKYKSDALFEFVGLEKRAQHNALTDAEYALKSCQIINQLVKFALS